MRTIRTLAMIAAPAFVLAGCAVVEPPMESSSATLCDPVESGEASEVVSVSGEKDGEIELTFPTPLNSEESQTTIIQEGEGREFTGEAVSRFQFSFYNSTTADLIASTGFDADSQLLKNFVTAENVPNFCNAFAGIPMGSSFVSVFTPEDFHGGQGIPDLGLEPENGVVMYVELEDFSYPRATGESNPQQAGFPTVILAPDGQPGIQPLDGTAPDQFSRNVLIEGSGDEIEIGDVVNVHYSGWTWDGTQFDSSWENGMPAEFTVSDQSLIGGFVQALEGVKAGSQVVAIIPPELGYGDAGNASIPGGATLVFVVDVLSID